MNYTEIKTVEDAYRATGRTRRENPIQSDIAPLQQIEDLCVVSEAIRDGWEPEEKTKYMAEQFHDLFREAVKFKPK